MRANTKRLTRDESFGNPANEQPLLLRSKRTLNGLGPDHGVSDMNGLFDFAKSSNHADIIFPARLLVRPAVRCGSARALP